MDNTTDDPVEATVEELSHLYEEGRKAAGPLQRLANQATRMLGRPASLAVVLGLILLWIAGNEVARSLGLHALDASPFEYLELALTIVALLTTLLILTTQRHEERADLRRDRLTLQIALLSEKKIAKVIALLEEQRRDNPLLIAREDAEAATMASATDPKASLHKLEASQRT